MNSSRLRFIKTKAKLEMAFVKPLHVFNRKVEGVEALFNLNYCGDKDNQHGFDVMKGEGENLPCILYLHGGGWAAFDKQVYRTTCKKFASAGTVVFNCNFRLAPKFGIDDMLEDLHSILTYVRANAKSYGGNPQKLIVAGDSGGAHLWSLYIGRALNGGDKQDIEGIAGCAFFYGAYDLTNVANLRIKRFEDYIHGITPEGADKQEYLKSISTIDLVTADHPPVFLSCGEIDPLTQRHTVRYAGALQQKGVKTKVLIFDSSVKDAKHRFINYVKTQAFKQTLSGLKEFLNEI